MSFHSTVVEKLETLPTEPGVYAFLDGGGNYLYVGKARSLRSRVRSYFAPGTSDVRAFITRLESEIFDIETIVTPTEKDAALLENQLIKERKPKYNVKLRDDKEFLSIRLDPKKPWPRLEVVRRPARDGAQYFGPYHSATSARQTLRLVGKHFQLRTCTDQEMKNRSRPCLQYQIKRCPGPCVFDVDKREYDDGVVAVSRFLSGKHDALIDELKERMKDASLALEFEKAAKLRDQLQAVASVQETHTVTSDRGEDIDVVGFFRDSELVEVAVLQVRDGRLISARTADLIRVSVPDDEMVASFLREWYEHAPVPKTILVPVTIEAADGLSESMSTRPRIRLAKSAAHKRLVEMAMHNASHAFREKRLAERNMDARLGQIAAKLGLPRLPRRIECIDISHHAGADTFAAIVVMQEGVPKPRDYRSYRIKGVAAGDDYGAMRDALSRRFDPAKREKNPFPDLFVCDGGRGQVAVACAVLAELGVTDVPVVGLAKERDIARKIEDITADRKVVDRVVVPGAKTTYPVASTPALRILAHARDEAHRFANFVRARSASSRLLQSRLELVRGIGDKTRQRLVRVLGSEAAVFSAGRESLIAAGATARQADAILKHADDDTPQDE